MSVSFVNQRDQLDSGTQTQEMQPNIVAALSISGYRSNDRKHRPLRNNFGPEPRERSEMVQFSSESDKNEKSCVIILDRLDTNQADKLVVLDEYADCNVTGNSRSKSIEKSK